MSEFDYSGWEHWKSYWRVNIKDDEEDEEEAEEAEEDEQDEQDDARETEDAREKPREAGKVYEDAYITDPEQAAETAHLWDGFENVTSCTRTSLEEQLQLQLATFLDHTPASSSPNSSRTSLSTPSHSHTSSDDDDDDDEWRPSAYYLQRSASISTLEVETQGLDLAFREEHIDPELRHGYSNVHEARKALYPYSEMGGAYGTGEEGETMRDWPKSSVPRKVQQTGYQSVKEARKALHPSGYGTGEEGEPMRDWSSEFYSPGEVGGGPQKCRGDTEEEGDDVYSTPLGSPVEDEITRHGGLL